MIKCVKIVNTDINHNERRCLQISKYIVKVSVNSKPLNDKEANDLKLSNKDYLQYINGIKKQLNGNFRQNT